MLVVLTALGLAVGCGGNDAPSDGERLSKGEYIGELTAVARELQAAIGASVDSTFTSPGPDELADLSDELTDRVEELRPPEEVDDVHVRLIAGLRESADELRQLAEVYRESETLDPIDAIVKLSEVRESQTLEEAAREFERRGYDMPAFFGGS